MIPRDKRRSMELQRDPLMSANDLTGRARIRNAALDLYGANGEDGTTMRAIASAAGVTVGLLVHHFGTKEGIRAAVEDLVVDYFAQAIAQVPNEGTPQEIATARDAAVGEMLRSNPAVVNYMRRVLLDPGGPNGRLLEKLIQLTHREIAALRDAGVASTRRRESSQVIELIVRQVGQLFLQPMIDSMWEHLGGLDAPEADKPKLSVAIREIGHRKS